MLVRKRRRYGSFMQLRRERHDDRVAVRHLHEEAFGDHGIVVARLVDALRASIGPNRGLSLVAEDDGELVGHVMFSPSLLDAPPKLVEVQVLSPIAVAPKRQLQGIGSALVRSGLQAMTEQGAPVVFLEGSPDYYPRFGFLPGAELGFRKPSLRIPDAAFQAIRLPAYEPWMTGTLVYAESFWRFDAVGLRDVDR